MYQFIKTKIIKPSKTMEEKKLKIKAKQNFYNKISFPTFHNAPVFLTVLILIVVLNSVGFMLNWYSIDPSISHGARNVIFSNYNLAIIKEFQVWRIFTFWLTENTSGIAATLLSSFFVWATFITGGYLMELLWGSKKTLIIWSVGIVLIFLCQFALVNFVNNSWYGTGYLSWIILGSLFYYFVFQTKDGQLKSYLVTTMLQMVFFLFFYEIYKLYDFRITLSHSSVEDGIDYPIYFISFAFIALTSGFLISMGLSYKKLNSSFSNKALIVVLVITILVIVCFTFLAFINGILKPTPTDNDFWKAINKFWE